MCYVLPVCYHVFEMGEGVIVGLPDMNLAQDKWGDDFLPVIEATPAMRALMPTRGEGSRGGQVKREVRFLNGGSIRFMTGQGSDKARAGKTRRVVAITETDGMDEPGAGSRESDPISQIEGRTRAYGRTGKRIYLECTVSIETGRIWQEIKQGTDSRLARPCPHCGEWVTPEREHLVGWQEAETEEAAAAGATWICPACGKPWSDEQRREAARNVVLVHRGQTIDREGRVQGELPETQTLGFRWSAIDNPFTTAADIGAEEWRARRRSNRNNAETELRQWVWCLPAVPLVLDLTPLDAEAVLQRRSGWKRGVVPEDAVGVAVGVDTGKRRLHWVALAVRRDGSAAVIEYGEQGVESDRLGVTAGLRAALQQLRDYWAKGWRDAAGKSWAPQQVWIDSGYWQHTDGVYEFCGKANTSCEPGREIYRPSKGYGEKQKGVGRYTAPRQRSADVLHVGSQYHLGRVRRAGRLVPGVVLCHVNADGWKSEVHQRLAMPMGEPGALVLYDTADEMEHGEFRDHLLAERQVETWISGRGNVATWEAIEGRPNHYLDALYDALAAGDYVQAQLAEATKPVPKQWFGSAKPGRAGRR
jgi:phage terminase large subunit GpA-like protein